MFPFHNHVNLKPLCLLLSLCHAGSAAALGLGEVSVHSHLGQPLHASVALLGAPPSTKADCFSIGTSPGSLAPPPRAQLSIKQSGGQTVLHIRTAQSVQDPIAQFVLVSDCEARLQREYVLLLDPPALEVAAAGIEAPTAAPTATQPIAAPAPRSTQRARRATAAASRPAAATARQPTVPRERAASPARPRLVLSGKHGAGGQFALRLDTNLPDLTRPRPDALTATELSDENTALSRKLAYLESQLAALQLRNAQLETKKPAASPTPATVVPASPSQPPQWPLYLLAIGLLSGGGALAAWLRSRSRSRRSQPATLQDDTAWAPLETLPAPSGIPQTTEPPPPAEPKPERILEFTSQSLIESTEIKDNILDQAEVYMAHGHGDLAVHLLQEHLREAPTESPVPWLLLLDLLHREGDTDGYAAASAECRRHFNVNLSSHPVSQDGEQSQGLEAYPHLIEQLVTVWNSPETDTFFNELIYDHRGGTRMGFEPGAYREILLLRAIAQDALALAA